MKIQFVITNNGFHPKVQEAIDKRIKSERNKK